MLSRNPVAVTSTSTAARESSLVTFGAVTVHACIVTRTSWIVDGTLYNVDCTLYRSNVDCRSHKCTMWIVDCGCEYP